MKDSNLRGLFALIFTLFTVNLALADYQASVINFGSLEVFSYEDNNYLEIRNRANTLLWSDTLMKGESGRYITNSTEKKKVHTVTGNGRFTLLNGDDGDGGDINTISGYYALDPYDKGVSTELYTSFPKAGGKFVVFAHEDETYIEVSQYTGQDDPNNPGYPEFSSIMRPSDPNYINKGEHLEWNTTDDFYSIWEKKLRITANKGVSALCMTDSGYYVPASNGTFSGQEFYTYFPSHGSEKYFVFVGYTDNTQVTVTQEGNSFLDFTLDKGQVYEHKMYEYSDTRQDFGHYYEVASSNNISVSVYNTNNRLVYTPGEDGSGFGSLDNYMLLNMLNGDDKLYILSHTNNTTVNLYNSANGLSADSGSTADDIFPALLDIKESVELTNGGVDIGCTYDYDYDVEVDSDDLVTVYYGFTLDWYAEFMPLGFDIIKPTNIDPNNLFVYDNEDNLIDLSQGGFSTDPNDTDFHYDILPGDEIDINVNDTFGGTDTNLTVKLYLAPEMNIDFATAMSGNYDDKLHAYTFSLGDMPAVVNQTLTLTISELAKPGTSINFHVKYESDQNRVLRHYHLEVGYWTSTGAVQGVVYVDQNATGYTSGTSWRNAFTDINQAMMFIEDSYYDYDSIWVATGAYAPISYCDLTDDSFVIYEGLSMYGGFAGNESSLDQRNIVLNKTILTGDPDEDGAADKSNVITITGNDTVLNGFVIKGSGQAGIKIDNTSTTGNAPEISFCAITDSGTYGIDIANSSATIANCNIYNNDSRAIHTDNNGDITILNSFIHKNDGGVYLSGADSSDEIRGNTIALNDRYGISADGEVKVTNNIIWKNDNQISGPLDITYNCIQNLDPNNLFECEADPNSNIKCDPLFAYPYDPNYSDFYDLHLSIESPCKELGLTSAVDIVNELDIDGSYRLEDDDVDMGADEISCWDTFSIYDINLDSRINMYEFAGMAATWLLNGPTDWNPDYNWADTGSSANIIDMDDFSILADNWLWRPCYITNSSMSDMVAAMAMASPMTMSLESTSYVEPVTTEVSIASMSVFDLTSTEHDPVVSDEIVTRKLSRSNLIDTKRKVDSQNPTIEIMALQLTQLENFIEEIKDQIPEKEYKKLLKEILEAKKDLYIMYMKTQLLESSK